MKEKLLALPKGVLIAIVILGIIIAFCCMCLFVFIIIPTDTANPTFTPTTINTPTLSNTSTVTITPTRRPTSTPTVTIEPATQTAISINSTATKIAGDATATKVSANAKVTLTAQQANEWATGTAQVKSDQATQIAKYTKINPKELITYPNNHIGEFVVIRGRVFNINSNTEFQMWLDGVSLESVYIVMYLPYSDIYEDDYVTVYGLIFGETCGTNAFGGEVCQPLVYGDFYEKK